MVFSSISFIFLILPLFVICDRLARLAEKSYWRNIALLSISLLFYAWGEAVNVFLLLFLGIINFQGGKIIHRGSGAKVKLILLVALNLAVLVGFKYTAWIFSLINPASEPLNISLPLGISFFTFHAVSYIVDIYRREIEPARSALNFMTYFCMFPHLVAGPIVRYAQVQTELLRRDDDPDMLSFGVYRFLLGFNKKILIANTVAPLADAAFLSPQVGGAGDAWLGIIAYTLQIYFDFSAYSDMAIGLAALAGFKFKENFLRPYSASSIQDFWRRWHISLSTWLRDYLYFPLGGNRKGRNRTYFNLLIVFFLCGLWHGADFTFVLWGLWHGFFLVLERLGLKRLLERLPVFLARAYTIVVVISGWVFFRAVNSEQAFNYLAVMFSPESGGLLSLAGYFSKAGLGIIAGALLCLMPDGLWPSPESSKPGALPLYALLVQAALFFPALIMLIGGSRNPFIYFNF